MTPRPADRVTGFTLIELLVVISIIALLISILLPALGAARTEARRIQNSANIRSVHQAMVTFAQGNNQMFPGVSSTEDYINRSYQGYSSATGATNTLAMCAYREMIGGGFVSSGFFVSPADNEDVKRPFGNDGGEDNDPTGDDTGVSFERRHASYGMIAATHSADIAQHGFVYGTIRWSMSNPSDNPLPSTDFSVGGGGLSVEATVMPEFAEVWQDNYDGQTPIVGDRVVWNDSAALEPNQGISVWVDRGDRWRGALAWNDGHVSFEPDDLDVSWEINGHTGNGIVPRNFDDPNNLIYNQQIFLGY